MNDELVEEVRKARREILASYNGDVEAMMREMMKRQWKSGKTVVSPKKKKPEPGVATTPYPLRK